MSNRVAFRNRILASLPDAELSGLMPHLVRVRMVNGQGLYEPGERIDTVFFFEEGMASMVAGTSDLNTGVEVGVIGREGMVGSSVLLNAAAVSFNRVMVQMPGVAYRMGADPLRECLQAMPMLRHGLHRDLEAFMSLVAQTAACNSRHTVTQRCARWLLLAHDRAEDSELPLTQEFIAIMLAVRRSGVTVALGTLKSAGLIQSRRGRIMVCDRPGLEAAACECYGRVQAYVEGLPAWPMAAG